MESSQGGEKAHAVCVPRPTPGNMSLMMKLAKLLHSRSFHVTFVLTDHTRARLLRTRGPRALEGLPSFRYASFPDGLPPSDVGAPQPLPALCDSLLRNGVGAFTDLLKGLEEGGVPPVSCVVSDMFMPFTVDAAEALGIKVVMFWPSSACGLLGFQQYPRLVREGYAPLKDASYLTNGYLDTVIDWIPAMKGICLKDLPSFLRTTNPDDIMFNFSKSMVKKSHEASAIIINTYNALEHKFLAALTPDFPPFYLIGPLNILADHIHDEETKSISSNLWEEDQNYIQWLDSKDPGSVVLVNFGKIGVMTNDQLVEFAFGIANTGKQFLWVIKRDLVMGKNAVVPSGLIEGIKERSLIVEWCDQERVLSHKAISGFLTHGGWYSIMESLCAGVPMICWPFFAEHQTNCWALQNEWGIGMEIKSDVKREVVERQVRELMDGEKGKAMKENVMEWKKLAEDAVMKNIGESWKNLEKLINNIQVFQI